MRRVVSPLALAALLAGCGGSGSSSPEGDIRATFATYVSGMRTKSFAKACETLSEVGRAEVVRSGELFGAGKTCEDTLRTTSSRVPSGPVELTALKVDGDRATFHHPAFAAYTPSSASRQDGRWRLEGVSPAVGG